MKHTKVPGLVPVNISSQFELYLGIKNQDVQGGNLSYNGDRLQFNRQECEFEVISGNQPHSDLQIWRFERQINHPKGVHSIIAVNANQRMFCEEAIDEDGQPYTDVNFTDLQTEGYSMFDPDSATSTKSNSTLGNLFLVFMDIDSEDGDILIKPYNPDIISEKFFCVDTDSGGIDFFEPETYASTRFVLNVPAQQVMNSSCEIIDMKKQRKVLHKNQDTLTNKDV